MNVLEARRRLLGAGVYKKTVIGNPAIAQGSLSRMYPGIEMQGWTEQAQYEGNQLLNLTKKTVNSSGITCVSEGSTITINGERVGGDGGRTTYMTIIFTLQPGTYSFSYEIFNDENSAVENVVFTKHDGDEIIGTNNFTLAEETNVYIGINMFEGKTADNVIIRCMLNAGSTALPWEPYTGGAPSPSPDYPQEIVSAGSYNQDTGKWEYEITIANAQTDATKNQTVTLTADRPLTKWDRLEKRDGQWGWVYKSKRFTSNDMFDFNDTWMPDMVWYIKNKEDYVVANKNFYCEYFKAVRASNIAGGGFAINMNDYPEIQTAGDMKDFVNSKEGSELPVTVCAETIQETFVPLSPEEQETMNALHTNRPTTVLSNNQDCEMTLTYKTKKSLEVTA